MVWFCQALMLLDVSQPNFQKRDNVYQMSFQANATKILDWLYAGSTQSTRLDRKYKKYGEIA